MNRVFAVAARHRTFFILTALGWMILMPAAGRSSQTAATSGAVNQEDHCASVLRLAKLNEKIVREQERKIAILETQLLRQIPSQAKTIIYDELIKANSLFASLHQLQEARRPFSDSAERNSLKQWTLASDKVKPTKNSQDANYAPEYFLEECGWVWANAESLSFFEQAYSIRIAHLEAALTASRGQQVRKQK
ncbi:MAG TPA: hypothetical protein VOA87_19260 [Thermoanaerobaculia bacterium]|nr:hypothetical protein [Thermoanaerobaculia bacterium]